MKKMMHSFGDVASTKIETVYSIEAIAQTYIKHLLESLVQETLKKHREKKQKKITKNFFRQRVNLGNVTYNDVIVT